MTTRREFLAASAVTLSAASYNRAADKPNEKVRVAVMGLRAAALQFGYLVGSGVGGIALALSGYAALGLVLALLFAAAAVPHLVLSRNERA